MNVEQAISEIEKLIERKIPWKPSYGHRSLDGTSGEQLYDELQGIIARHRMAQKHVDAEAVIVERERCAKVADEVAQRYIENEREARRTGDRDWAERCVMLEAVATEIGKTIRLPGGEDGPG